jgi:hypothetical protein
MASLGLTCAGIVIVVGIFELGQNRWYLPVEPSSYTSNVNKAPAIRIETGSPAMHHLMF